MKMLIPVNSDKRTCLASDLHSFLQHGKQFADWCKQYIASPDWGFIEGMDYWIFSPISEKIGRSRPKQDYELTLGCAKEIAMLQRSEKGKQARKYFIKIEEEFWKLLELKQDALTFPQKKRCKHWLSQ